VRSRRWGQIWPGSSDHETLAQHDLVSTAGADWRSVARLDGIMLLQLVQSRSCPRSCAGEVAGRCVTEGAHETPGRMQRPCTRVQIARDSAERLDCLSIVAQATEHPDCQRRRIYFVSFETAWILPLALSSYSVSPSTCIFWPIHVLPDFSAQIVLPVTMQTCLKNPGVPLST
jgi:hypothetical protein